MTRDPRIPSHVQVWPFGHGVVLTSVGVDTMAGMLCIAAVPDDMRTTDWQNSPPPGDDPIDTMRQLMTNPKGQSAVLVFKDAAAVNNLINQLQQVKAELSNT